MVSGQEDTARPIPFGAGRALAAGARQRYATAPLSSRADGLQQVFGKSFLHANGLAPGVAPIGKKKLSHNHFKCFPTGELVKNDNKFWRKE